MPRKTATKIKNSELEQIDSSPFFAGDETFISKGSCGTSSTSRTSSRRKRAATINRTDVFVNIADGISPFNKDSSGYISIHDTIELCRKAYWQFGLLKNTIDVMTELSNSEIYLEGGNKKSRNFIKNWFKKINLWSLKEQFFREFYRSANVFIYKFNGIISLKKINNSLKDEEIEIPLVYTILNPEDIRLEQSINYLNPEYYQYYNGYTLNRLNNPKTDMEKSVVENLSEEQRRLLKQGTLLLPIKKEHLHTIFYKKQDYEPFAVPLAFPVLEDINAKLELKKIDMAVARSTDWAILLLTMGDENGVNHNNISRMKELMSNESVSRVLVSDYTTKAEWLIPDVHKILGKEKYEQINEDIRIGLNNILFTADEKFSNTHIKVKVFIQRLESARQSFIENFLQNEIENVCKKMNFKSIPNAKFSSIGLEDNLQWSKIYIALQQAGVLTPEEVLEAIESGKLPNSESESLESQRKFKKLQEEGLYLPFSRSSNQSSVMGRPSGSTGIPQQTQNISPIGEGEQSKTKAVKFNVKKIAENLTKAAEIQNTLESKLKKKFKIRHLNQDQINIAQTLTQNILINEKPHNYIESIASYVEKPIPMNQEQAKRIDEICVEHEVDSFMATILNLSVEA